MSARDTALGDKYKPIDLTLTILAQQKNSRVRSWLSVQERDHKRIYLCNLCGKELDRESGHYKQTKHVQRAVAEHRTHHVNQIGGDIEDTSLVTNGGVPEKL